MLHIIGTIWQEAAKVQDALIVIPTNVGWTQDGLAVMGRGLALQAKKKHPSLPAWYGGLCRELYEKQQVTSPGVVRFLNLLLFPVKPLLVKSPYLSWRQPADLATIEDSISSLLKRLLEDKLAGCHVFMPRVGCGNGGLPWSLVQPLLEKYLEGPKFVCVSLQKDVDSESAFEETWNRR